ncbi:hypothetical protein N9O56_00510 [Rickettsiales bacterium]|nr:hypothetical protein [Rickettsiales bacterium]
MKLLFIILLSLIYYQSLISISSARPISYGGGWTLMQKNNHNKNSIHLHYSPSYKYSIGYKSEYLRENNISLNSLQLNNLIKRWNLPAAQGNLYLKSNIGNAAKSKNNEIYSALGLATDFETRRYFISYQNNYYKSDGDVISIFQQNIQFGIAPYVANYNNIHSWVMIRIDHEPDSDDNKIIKTGLIRLFKGVNLLELGITSNKKLLFNLIKRF